MNPLWSEKYSEEDINSVRYFMEEKDDPARWIGWAAFLQQNPEAAKYWEMIEYQESVLRDIKKNFLDTLEDNVEYED